MSRFPFRSMYGGWRPSLPWVAVRIRTFANPQTYPRQSPSLCELRNHAKHKAPSISPLQSMARSSIFVVVSKSFLINSP